MTNGIKFGTILPMKLILIRHGESARNRGYKVSDEENNLTTKGVEQAVKVGEALKEQKIEAIYGSSAPRCVQTVEEILRNRDDNMAIHFSKLLAPKMKHESYEKLKAKVELFLDDLKYDHKENETVIIVSHQLVLAMIILQLTGNTRRLENGEMVGIEVKNEKVQ
jgi:broad specificity phosphatase PhoE